MTAHARPKAATNENHKNCELCGNPSETTQKRSAKCGACGQKYKGPICDACTLAFEAQEFCALADEVKSILLRSPGPTTHNTGAYNPGFVPESEKNRRLNKWGAIDVNRNIAFNRVD